MIDGLVDLGDKIFSHVQKRRWADKDSIHQDSRNFFCNRYINVREIKNHGFCLYTANNKIDCGKNKAHS